ncbi:MAG: NAD(P)-binding protein, partial [Planctomycetes bacterium]|nr:NAD(P)-binding protein [Planctomycetota bacterium]
MRIAIIGTGISGLVAADLLHREHDLALFEASDRIGGHTNTIEVDGLSIDTGFIVYNERTYPLFTALLRRLGVATQPTTMSFSVRCDRTGLEYNGTSLDGLFAQRRNLLRPSFLGMIRQILRFNREAPRLLGTPAADLTLGELLDRGGYGRAFREHYLLPMGAAIWSAPEAAMLDFPAGFFIRFFHNHGMLSVNDRPVWRVVSGGSRYYVDALSHPFRDRIRLRTRVHSVRRLPHGVAVDGELFDEVVLACCNYAFDVAQAIVVERA